MPQVQAVQEHPDHPKGGRQYGKFQTDIYSDGLLKNALPIVTTDPNKLEAQAKEHLGVTSYNYVAGGAGERATMVGHTVIITQICTKLIVRRMPTVSHLDNGRWVLMRSHPCHNATSSLLYGR